MITVAFFAILNFIILLSALLEGVQNNDMAAVHRILQYDNVDRKNFNVNGSLYTSLLHVAAHNNNYEICEMLLKFDADVNMLDLEHQTPLNVAESNLNYTICQRFVKKRAHRENKIVYKKQLHVYARKNDLSACERHINSLDVNKTGEKGRTPLHVAVIFATVELCELLLMHGADVNAKDNYNDSPIHLAFYYGRHALRRKFLFGLTYFG